MRHGMVKIIVGVLLSSFCVASILPVTVSAQTKSSDTKTVKKAPKEKYRGPLKNKVKAKMTDHRDSYRDKPKRGEHINVKVTPPEKRGESGVVIVEVYNYSNYTIEVARLILRLKGDGYNDYPLDVTFEDLSSQDSKIKRPTIPGGTMDKITEVVVQRSEFYGPAGVVVDLPVFVDIIKK